MIDLFEELKTLTAKLTDAGIDYALAGGLAMKTEMAPPAVTARLKRVSQLRRLCLALARRKTRKMCIP